MLVSQSLFQISTICYSLVMPRIRRPGTLPPAEGQCINRSSELTVREDVGVDLCVGAGTTLTIDCVADRGIPVTFNWTRNGGPLTSAESVQAADNSLRVDVRAGGGATYRCTATNPSGSASRETTITVTGSEGFKHV